MMKTLRKKHRSMIRILVSCLPDFMWKFFIPKTPRMHISAYFLERISSLYQNSLSVSFNNQSLNDFKDFMPHQGQGSKFFNSTPKRSEIQENVKITALQKELDEIKKQIAQLMERQYDQFQCSDLKTSSNPSKKSQESFLPPPPPPPLPDLKFNTVTTFVRKDSKKTSTLLPAGNNFPSREDLIKDLKNVQLRKIEKSPGGGPVKKPKTIKDPGDFLELVLKKRFKVLHNSPESSLESASFNASNPLTDDIHNYELKNTAT